MDAVKIGALIKKIRKDNNLTQLELANKLGVTYQAVSKWENGKNIPDIAILKEICELYNLDVNDFLDGKSKVNNKSKYYIMFGGLGVILIVILVIGLISFKNNKFEFKMLKANCSNFNITGSIAYNEVKSAIYISNIDYCGQPKKEKYQKIACKLYEQEDDVATTIQSCDTLEDITLDDYLKGITFNVDDYTKSCKNYTENSLYLEIEATKDNLELETFKIPLKLEDMCNNSTNILVK